MSDNPGIDDQVDGISITLLAKSQGIGRSKMREILFEIIPPEESYVYSNKTIFPKNSVDKHFDQLIEKVEEVKKNKNKMKLPKKFIMGMAEIDVEKIEDGALYSRRQLGTLCGVSSQTIKRVEDRYIDDIYYKYEIMGDNKKRFMGYEGVGVKKAIFLCKKIREREAW